MIAIWWSFPEVCQTLSVCLQRGALIDPKRSQYSRHPYPPNNLNLQKATAIDSLARCSGFYWWCDFHCAGCSLLESHTLNEAYLADEPRMSRRNDNNACHRLIEYHRWVSPLSIAIEYRRWVSNLLDFPVDVKPSSKEDGTFIYQGRVCEDAINNLWSEVQ